MWQAHHRSIQTVGPSGLTVFQNHKVVQRQQRRRRRSHGSGVRPGAACGRQTSISSFSMICLDYYNHRHTGSIYKRI